MKNTVTTLSLAASVCMSLIFTGCSNTKPYFGTYITGEFHQHTAFTDGSLSMPYVMKKEDSGGLGWWVNSEHGGLGGHARASEIW